MTELDRNYAQRIVFTYDRHPDTTDEEWAAACAPKEPEPWSLRDDLASALETSYRLADDALRAIREAGYVIVPKDGGDPIPWNDEDWG
jgi:hypothetical protein